MSKDPYTTLGVKRGASADDIRAAYKKLVKLHHPDRNPGDKTAEETFKQISAAYSVLGDPDKRKRFDAGEIDGQGQETGGYGGGFDGFRGGAGATDFSDVFSDLFGGRGASYPTRGADHRYTLEIDFLDAVHGVRKRVTFPEAETLDIEVPPGVTDGRTLRLRGKGEPGIGRGAPGDALVELRIRTHPFFSREGDDIVLDLPVTLDEAVLGAKVEVPTIEGPVALTIPAGSSSGQVLRLRRRGVKSGAGRGDQLVKVRIVLPAKVDEELADFLRDWRKHHAYDPRARFKASV